MVYAISKTLDNLLSLKEEFPTIEIIQVDLGDWKATREAVRSIGAVEGLVNNAAILGPQTFLNIEPDTFDQVINVNLKSVINVSQIVVEGMRDSKNGGAIVNISTVATLGTFPFVTSYCLSKAGLEMLTKLMAVELGPHKIRVNAICNGFTAVNGVLTDMATECHAAGSAAAGVTLQTLQEGFAKKSPLGELSLNVGDVINSTLFLLSDVAYSMTGRCVILDNGLTL